MACVVLAVGCGGAGTPGSPADPDGGAAPGASTTSSEGGPSVPPAPPAPPPAPPPPPPAPSCSFCAQYGTPQDRGALPAKLVETSGIVASRAHPGILYAHNDAGDTARIVAFDHMGAEVAELTLTGATNVDYEDIAIGPCPQGPCVYVGDIGDNDNNRTTKTVYRFREPALAPGQAPSTIAVTVEAFPFAYPGTGQLHNAETLLVHPTSGDVYVVTKEARGVASKVFKFPQPLTAAVTATLVFVATLPFPAGNDPDLSGGDVHPCGGAVLFRIGNARIYQLTAAPGQPFDSIFTPAPTAIKELPMANEGNAEAISWSADGRGYFTAAEGRNAMLHHVGCTN
jgi:hypothetical protein